MSSRYLPQLDYIRAIASLAVCFFHLACGNVNLLNKSGLFYEITKWGWLGVEMFFVLSGFVICWSMPPNYTISSNIKPFLQRRLFRIEPPYLISVLVVIVLNFLSLVPRGLSYEIEPIDIFSHVAYLANFEIGEYYNEVYWTLGIEFQFYILVAFLFPLLNRKMI